jgi:hypothetical protein
MKMKYFIISGLILFLVMGFVFQIQAGDPKRKGSAAAEELLVPVGARGSALAGSVLANVQGTDAIYWNPAGLANSENKVEVMLSYHKYIADIGLGYAAVGVQTGIGTLGFSFKTFDFGDITETTESAPEGTGAVYSPNYLTLGATYSKDVTDRIYIGVTAKMISERIMEMYATGVAFDAGIQYKTAIGLKMGVVMRNWGTGLKFSGDNMEHRVEIGGTEPQTPMRRLSVPAQTSELPSLFELGLAYDFSPIDDLNLSIMGSFRNHNFACDEVMGGIELGFKDMVFVRGAFMAAPEEEAWGWGSDDYTYLWGPSFGFGLKYPITGSVNIALDMAYQTAQYFENPYFMSMIIGF